MGRWNANFFEQLIVNVIQGGNVQGSPTSLYTHTHTHTHTYGSIVIRVYNVPLLAWLCPPFIFVSLGPSTVPGTEQAIQECWQVARITECLNKRMKV